MEEAGYRGLLVTRCGYKGKILVCGGERYILTCCTCSSHALEEVKKLSPASEIGFGKLVMQGGGFPKPLGPS